MKNIIYIMVMGLCLLSPSHGQGTAAAPARQEQKKDIPQNLQKGLRFVAIDRIPVNPSYIVLGKDMIKELTVRTGTPGARFPYPESGRLVLIKNIPEKEGEKPEVLLNVELPSNLTDKTIVVLGSTAKGLYAMFVDETELKPGTVLFKNMTTKPYLMEMPTAPGNEPKRVLLEGGKDHVFGKTELKSGEDGKTYPVIWRHKVKTKSGEEQWFVERKMMAMRYLRRAVVVLVRPDSSGRTTRMHEFIVFLPAPKTEASANTPIDGMPER